MKIGDKVKFYSNNKTSEHSGMGVIVTMTPKRIKIELDSGKIIKKKRERVELV